MRKRTLKSFHRVRGGYHWRLSSMSRRGSGLRVDDRSVFTGSLQLIQRHFFLTFQALFQVEIDSLFVSLGNLLVDFFKLDRVRCSVIFFQCLRDGSLGGHHGLDIESVINLMSSMAKTFVGSTLATVRVLPTRLKGTTIYF